MIARIMLLSYLSALVIACEGKIKLEAEPVNVTTGTTTAEVNVRHEIVVSLEMKQMFRDTCTAEVPVNEVDLCVQQKTEDFINKFLALLTSGGSL